MGAAGTCKLSSRLRILTGAITLPVALLCLKATSTTAAASQPQYLFVAKTGSAAVIGGGRGGANDGRGGMSLSHVDLRKFGEERLVFPFPSAEVGGEPGNDL